jgi:hypothetical protein
LFRNWRVPPRVSSPSELRLPPLAAAGHSLRISKVGLAGVQPVRGHFNFCCHKLGALLGAKLTGLQYLSLLNVLLCDDNGIAPAAAPSTQWASLKGLKVDQSATKEVTLCVADALLVAAPYLTRLHTLRISCYGSEGTAYKSNPQKKKRKTLEKEGKEKDRHGREEF